MQLLTFAAFLLAAALPAIAKVMLAPAGKGAPPTLRSLALRTIAYRGGGGSSSGNHAGDVDDEVDCGGGLSPIPASPRCCSPGVQSVAVLDDILDRQPLTYYGGGGGRTRVRPQSRKRSVDSVASGSSARSGATWASMSSGASNNNNSSSSSSRYMRSGSPSPQKVRFLEVRDGVFVQREVDAPPPRRRPASPAPSRPGCGVDTTARRLDSSSKSSSSGGGGCGRDHGYGSGCRAVSFQHVGEDADLAQRAATWASQRGLDSDVGLEDFEKRSVLGRAIRRLKGPSRRSRAAAAQAAATARAHVVPKAERRRGGDDGAAAGGRPRTPTTRREGPSPRKGLGGIVARLAGRSGTPPVESASSCGAAAGGGEAAKMEQPLPARRVGSEKKVSWGLTVETVEFLPEVAGLEEAQGVPDSSDPEGHAGRGGIGKTLRGLARRGTEIGAEGETRAVNHGDGGARIESNAADSRRGKPGISNKRRTALLWRR